MEGIDFEFWGLLFAVLASQGAMFRWVLAKMHEHRTELQKEDAILHSRIEDVKDNYLRRDDLDAHIQPLKESLKTMTASIDRLHTRFDDFLTANIKKTE